MYRCDMHTQETQKLWDTESVTKQNKVSVAVAEAVAMFMQVGVDVVFHSIVSLDTLPIW